MKTKIIILIGILAAGLSFSQEFSKEMTLEEYNIVLADWQAKEQTANDEIAQLQGEIDALKAEIVSLGEQILAVKAETLALLGVTEGDVGAYLAELSGLLDALNQLAGLAPEELYQHRDEMDMHAENFAGLKSNPMAVLDKSVVVIKNIDRVFDTIDSIMPKPFFDLYSVVKNDNLWRISGKEDIYSDPYQWMKIYSANRDQIKDANLIFPDQEFKIPRRLEDNQHEVAKGEHLTFVSESRYGNPFDWHKIYEANKNVIDDPNTVYPHTILTIP